MDNAGLYLQQSVNDTMYSEAVAFRISVSDTSGMIGLAAKKYVEIGISSCMANEPEPSFKPAQMIENINVVSLFDISDSVKANTDVTAFFCYNTDDYSGSGDLYLTWDQLAEIIAGRSYDNQMLSFDLFLKESVMAENSQFIISLSLSDGRTLQDTTALITIINEDY